MAIWLEAGRPEEAHPVLAALARREGPGRLRALGALARVAGGVGEQPPVREALTALMAEPLGTEGRAAALLEAAEGAFLLGWMDEAEAASRAALGSATRLGEPGAIAAARSLLTRSAARRAVGPTARGRRQPGEPGPMAKALAAALEP